MAMVQNTTRITGMISGMDTDLLVKGMMISQQLKLDRLSVQKTRSEWKRDTITDFNSQIRQFVDNFGSVIGKTSMMQKGSYMNFNTEMAKNTTAFTVKGVPGAQPGSHSLRVDQVTTAATARSMARVTGTIGGHLNDADFSKSINQLKSEGLIDSGLFTVGGSDQISFTLNGKDFTFSGNDSLTKVMDTINKSDIGAAMNYSQITDTFTFTGTKTGAGANDLEFGSPEQEQNFLEFFGFAGIDVGQNAIVSINGGQTREFAANSFTLDGLEINLNRATGGETFEFTITKNTQAAVDNIKAFVEEFNKLVKTFYEAFHEKKNYDFRPLTEDQKQDMTEKEIEEWDKNARAGLMARDNRLGTMLNEMRRLIGENMGGAGNLASIGITTSGYKAGEVWELVIDEEKLSKALETNADGVFNILGASDRAAGGGGFVSRVSKAMEAYVASTKSADLQNLTTSINDYNRKITEQENKMFTMSEKYYVQYAKMESALSEMQSQTNQLMGLFGMQQQQQQQR